MNEPLRGIALNLVAGMIFCVADTIAKGLAGELAIVQITWTRYVVFVLMAFLLTTRIRGASFYVRQPRLQLARGLCLVCSSLLFVLGIRDVSLAEATTIGFIGPILVTFLSIPLLGERVDARRWSALAGGTLGVLVVLRPGTGTFHPEGLYRVGSALFWSLGVILTRRMTATERAETTMFWSAVSGLAVLSAIIPFHFVRPTATQLGLSIGQGVLSSLGQWLSILSLRYTPVSTLAPYSYTQLVWTTIAGSLFSACGRMGGWWRGRRSLSRAAFTPRGGSAGATRAAQRMIYPGGHPGPDPTGRRNYRFVVALSRRRQIWHSVRSGEGIYGWRW